MKSSSHVAWCKHSREVGGVNPSHGTFACVHEDKRLNISDLHTKLIRINSSFYCPAKIIETLFFQRSSFYSVSILWWWLSKFFSSPCQHQRKFILIQNKTIVASSWGEPSWTHIDGQINGNPFAHTPLHNQNNTGVTSPDKTLMCTRSPEEVYSDFHQCVVCQGGLDLNEAITDRNCFHLSWFHCWSQGSE